MAENINNHEIKWKPEEVARIWDYYSKNPSYRNQYFALHSGDAILKWVSQRIKLHGKEVLDFGCGPGFFLEKLLSPRLGAASGSGMDFSTRSIEATKDRLANNACFKQAVLAQTLPTPLPPESFDVVFLMEVIEHLDDAALRATVGEAMRVLHKGGYIVVTTPNEEDLDANKTICPECGCIFHRWQHLRRFDLSSVRSNMEFGGFSTIHAETLNWEDLKGPFPLQWAKKGIRLIKRQMTNPHIAYIGQK